VALRAIESRSAQKAMDETVELTRQTIARKDVIAESLEMTYSVKEICSSERNIGKDIGRFVESCKCMATGSVSWG
jgi:hypothetical protein